MDCEQALYFSFPLVSRFVLVSRFARNIAFAPLGSESACHAGCMYCKTVIILLRIRVRGHFVMSITNNHESQYFTVLDNPPELFKRT